MTHKWTWFFYLSGALLTLAWKLIRYVHISKQHGDTVRKALMEWFFEDSTDNTVSWVTTIGAVWVFGSVYIDRVVVWWDWLNAIPVTSAIAFFFGGMMEMVAPAITKSVVGYVTRKVQL